MRTLVSVLIICATIVATNSHYWGRKCKKNGDSTDEKECVSLCILKHAGTLNDKGELNLTKFNEDMKPKVEECGEKNKQVQLCERAEALSKCIREAVKQRKEDVIKQCASETNTEVDTDHKDTELFQLDDSKACYQRCVLIKLWKMNEENEMNLKNLFKNGRNRDNLEQIAINCTEEHTEEDKCIQAIRRVQCVNNVINPKKKQQTDD